MAETTLIALTGGPCAGKTTAMEFLAEAVKKHGVEVFCVNEQATALKRSGRTPESMGQFGFHRLLFENQLAEEERALSDARASKAEKALVLCDRGLLDSRAYVDEADFVTLSPPRTERRSTTRSRIIRRAVRISKKRALWMMPYYRFGSARSICGCLTTAAISVTSSAVCSRKLWRCSGYPSRSRSSASC